jgi:hypothetical protein
MKRNLTKETREPLDGFEKDKWLPVPDISKRKKELTGYVRSTRRVSHFERWAFDVSTTGLTALMLLYYGAV